MQYFYIFTTKKDMGMTKKLSDTEMWELRDHRDNTCKYLIKCYTISQLSYMEGSDTNTIKAHPERFLPVRVEDSKTLYAYKNGKCSKPYQIRYIRMDEVKYLFNKHTDKKLTTL